MAESSPVRYLTTDQVASSVDAFVSMCEDQRKPFERRWFNNNFFDDGYHFRFVSRTTGRIIDQENKNSISPERAIPKASRQIRGVVNLLLQPEYVPVIYPENISKANYGQDVEAYKQAVEMSKDIAKKSGHWVTEEFKNQEINDKFTLMGILTAKHGVSYLQTTADPVKEKLDSIVRDAFDVYVIGTLQEIYDSPMCVIATPVLISEIKANELFDEDQKKRISADNKFASSEIKQAYMQSRFGNSTQSEYASTLILKEAYIKEYINSENIDKIAQDLGADYKGKKEGDLCIRHVFSAGGVWLYDKYTTLPRYPLVDLRFEPGPIYQVPLIERFIPANKSLDIVMSRVERYTNSMVVGVYQKRKGENFTINNSANAQVIEYDTVPLAQMQVSPVPQFVFQFMAALDKIIEEQGASTSTLGNVPTGVKSGIAIEAVKETEYANLKIPASRLKLATKRIAENLLDLADNYFVNPQTVNLLEQGEPNYFDVIGKSAIAKRNELNIDTPQGVVPLSKSSMVDIQIESGMGFTESGKRKTMQEIANFMAQMAGAGYLSQEAVQVVVTKFLDTFGYGSTQEFIDAMDNGTQGSPLSESQLLQMKTALLETLKEAGEVGPEAEQRLVDSTKLGVAEAMKDLGMTKPQEAQPVQPKGPSESISFKDLPNSGKVQMAAKAGIDISPDSIVEDELTKKAIGSMGNTKTPEPQA